MSKNVPDYNAIEPNKKDGIVLLSVCFIFHP